MGRMGSTMYLRSDRRRIENERSFEEEFDGFLRGGREAETVAG